MFFSKTPGTFEKHLPEATRAALRNADGQGLLLLQQLSLMTSQLNSQGQQLQTFEAGPTLLAVEDSRTNSKFDVTVERDDLRGEADEIELSFHAYKDGQPQASFVSPHLTFLMKQQTGIWRMHEITVAIHMALDNPEFLKEMTKNMANLGAADSVTGRGPAKDPRISISVLFSEQIPRFSSHYPFLRYRHGLELLSLGVELVGHERKLLQE